eukprot:CCRYP_009410-RA/>CCRYP_009410-RA protein AED:0.29 eAED:0.29 QI:759/1/1/1/0/0/2/405/64
MVGHFSSCRYPLYISRALKSMHGFSEVQLPRSLSSYEKGVSKKSVRCKYYFLSQIRFPGGGMTE